MKLFQLLFFLSIQNLVFSQDLDTTFYNAKWEELNYKSDSAIYFRISEKINDSITRFSDFLIYTNALYCKGEFTHNIKSGRWTFFYPNGEIRKDYKFINNGNSKHWYKFDEDSLKPDVNGIYFTTNVTPRFIDGMSTFNDFIVKNFELPKKVKQIGIRSFKVSYQLIINEKGRIVEIWDQENGINILNEDFQSSAISDKSLLKIKKTLNRKLRKFLLKKSKWSPATLKEVPVKSAKYVSIKY